MAAFFTAPAIAWGPGAIEQLSGVESRRAFLLVDRSVAALEGPRRAAEELEKSGAVVEVVAEDGEPPDLATVARVADRLRAFAPDWIVAVGGGSLLDLAKASRLAFERPELTLGSPPSVLELPETPRSRLAAVPTTSGSGAEASWSVDLFGPDGEPLEVAHRSLVPAWALVDPAFASALPVERLVDGALETAALATEAYLSAWSNPFSDALAVDALGTVVHRLPHAVRWSDDPEARAALHYAATSAGLAASNAQRGVAHAIARALVRPTGLSYGAVIGLVVPFVLDFDRPAARERLDALSEAVAGPEETGHLGLAERFRRLHRTLGRPRDLAAAGVPLASVRASRSRIVADALRSPAVLANPRVPNAAELGEIVDAVVGTPV